MCRRTRTESQWPINTRQLLGTKLSIRFSLQCETKARREPFRTSSANWTKWMQGSTSTLYLAHTSCTTRWLSVNLELACVVTVLQSLITLRRRRRRTNGVTTKAHLLVDLCALLQTGQDRAWCSKRCNRSCSTARRSTRSMTWSPTSSWILTKKLRPNELSELMTLTIQFQAPKKWTKRTGKWFSNTGQLEPTTNTPTATSYSLWRKLTESTTIWSRLTVSAARNSLKKNFKSLRKKERRTRILKIDATTFLVIMNLSHYYLQKYLFKLPKGFWGFGVLGFWDSFVFRA